MPAPARGTFTGILLAFASCTVATAQPARLDPAAFDRPIRVAFVGDNITQPSVGLSASRGPVPLPGATPAQVAIATSLVAAQAAPAAAAAAARTALAAASLRFPADRPAIEAAAAALRDAELTLALARAESYGRLQRSTAKLSPENAAALSQQMTGGRAGRGASLAAVATTMVASTDYPTQAAGMLGPGWDARNFGVSGTTLLKRGDLPFWQQPAFDAARNFNPDAVVIAFGSNDSKAANWRSAAEFEADLREMIAAFRSLPAQPRIWIARPAPAFNDIVGVDDRVITGEIIPAIDRVARAANAGVIDFHRALQGRGDLLPDGVNPDPAGSRLLAAAVHAALTGQPAPP